MNFAHFGTSSASPTVILTLKRSYCRLWFPAALCRCREKENSLRQQLLFRLICSLGKEELAVITTFYFPAQL